MLFDIHAHAFFPKIASRAVAHLNDAYSLQCIGTGLCDDLLDRERRAGIDRCVVLCAATDPHQVSIVNDYAVKLQREYPEIIAFGTIHPGFSRWESELDRLKRLGIRGLKLHPDFQGFWLNDHRLLPIFEAAQNDFIFEIHIGQDDDPAKSPSCPYKLAAILDNFPKLRCIAAHLGGYHQWEHALHTVVGRENLWLDTSSSTMFIGKALFQKILRRHPSDHILFGTDYPLYDPLDEIQRFKRLADIDDAVMEKYLSNAGMLLELEEK
ncbi:MAG: amidohydrolase family protein [Desulfovibrionaceae bacterium]|nr:amidohydrolase family protein [Desulfovibrionaceae bacterium]